MDSARLPGKALLPLQQRPLIHWSLLRALRADLVDHVFLLTSDRAVDDALEHACRDLATVIRGSADDVLSRFLEMLTLSRADVVVRITGDCPFVDPQLIDQVISLREAADVDYAHTAAQREYAVSFPNGMAVEVVTAECLRTIECLATSPEEREHVTLAVSHYPDQFTTRRLLPEPGLSRPTYKFSVDTAEDYATVSRVVKELGPVALSAGIEDLIRVMDYLTPGAT